MAIPRPTPDYSCLLVEGQRHNIKRFPGVPGTKSSILLTIRIHQVRWRVVVASYLAVAARLSLLVFLFIS
jgi:hypothetical protein